MLQCQSMSTVRRTICYLPLLFAVLDEPTNAVTIHLCSLACSFQAEQSFPDAQRPARGLDDVTDLARTLPPLPPPLLDGPGETLLGAFPTTSDAELVSSGPDFFPLLC